MTKKQFMNQYVIPYLKENDRPFNRQLFNDSLDMAYNDGLITDKQVNTWIYPKTKLFE